MSSAHEDWFGLGPSGEERKISHAELMRWARQNEMAFDVGWGEAVTINGTRLVRGKTMLATARSRGWNDLADKLHAFGVRDELRVIDGGKP